MTTYSTTKKSQKEIERDLAFTEKESVSEIQFPGILHAKELWLEGLHAFIM